MKKKLLLLMIVLFSSTLFAQSGINITCLNKRKAYLRSENSVFAFKVENTGIEDVFDAELKFNISNVIDKSKLVSIKASQSSEVEIKVDFSVLKKGQYNAKAYLVKSDKLLVAQNFEVYVCQMWNQDRIRVWLWPHYLFGSVVYKATPEAKEMLRWYTNIGFNSFNPGGGVGLNINYGPLDEKKMELFDYMLFNGLETGFSGYSPYFFEMEDKTLYAKIRKTHGRESIPNPFNPKVVEKQNQLNIEMMEILQDFPGIKICFMESEYEDYMPWEFPLSKESFPEEYRESAVAKSTDSGVIADDDLRYARHKYRFLWGDGIRFANGNIAKIVHKYRPDIITFSDPLRKTALPQRFADMDAVSTWTYTNPDPKYMLYVDILRAVAKCDKKEVFHTITMINRPGSIAPKEGGMTLMGPDRLLETSWINLSRNPGALSYYIGSSCDQFSDNNKFPYQIYPETFTAMAEFNQKVVVPFGPMISKLKARSQKTAVLCNESSFVYRQKPSHASYYQTYYIMDFLALMAMNQIPVDVILEQDVLDGKLNEYKDLFLIRCDTLTESVYDEIKTFEGNGGRIYADTSLRASIDNAVVFDFDFGYRNKVSVEALKENIVHTGGGDTLEQIMSKKEKAIGVPADVDQRIMIGYADELGKALEGKVYKDINCSSKEVVSNILYHGDVRYLFLINDKRTYSDRFMEQGMLDKGVANQLEIELLANKPESYVYDMLGSKILKTKAGKFDISLPPAGGKILALSDQMLSKAKINAPESFQQGKAVNIEFLVQDSSLKPFKGVVPIEVVVKDPDGQQSAYSDYYAAKDGKFSLEINPALNDVKGEWKIHLKELFTGEETYKTIELK